ncbi:beta-galactosidase GalB [Povalibacter sp.]|uniref:beta-galactosidase GalB n=1 Tax=Povalibacter sp. TaxID=1962978 RepID=UPI0032C230BB
MTCHSAALGQALLPDARSAVVAPREHTALDTGWRFHRGDPEDAREQLHYAVRPGIIQSVDGKDADARPETAAEPIASRSDVLKPWILPTANPFIRDASRWHVRPAGDPGSDVSFVRANFDDSGWRQVTLPHDWAIEGPFLADGPYGGMGRLKTWGAVWYRKRLDIPATDAGRSIFLTFDGAMSYATVWLNGRLVGGWPYGYASWRVDLTSYVEPGGQNQLAIRLDNPPESARWYPGAGLYRSVWLTKTHPVHVAHWGTVVRTPTVSAKAATVELQVSIDNDASSSQSLEVATEICALDDEGRKHTRPSVIIPAQKVEVAAKERITLAGSAVIANPRLWGPRPHQQPHRYIAVTSLTQGGKRIDRYETRFGIRSLRFDPNSGVYVNGQHIPIRGVNNHHDLGALGAAFNYRAAERQLEMLQEMGANAVRMAHNPPAPELLELTDRLGMLVVDEIFDSWERKKTPLDFHLIFRDWHEPDLRAMLRRDRNHPSVVLWSVGNEVGEQYTAEEGAAIARRLQQIVREGDPTRPTINAMNWAKSDMPLPAVLDVIGLNYQGEGIRDTPEFAGTDRIRTPPQYQAFRQKFPDKVILSTETASTLSSRGVYLFPVSPENSAPVRDGRGGDSTSHQVSGYELNAVDFGSSPDRVFAALDRHPFVAGEFVWTGWDYLGEPTPYYSSRSSYSGIIDLAGFRKDRFYLYQSRWRSDLPAAHIVPHWTWPERVGQATPVHVFTSGDQGELFINGQSQGRLKKGAFEYRLRWDDVRYAPGEVKVVVYKSGKQWAVSSTKTAGAAAGLEVVSDRSTIRADGKDLAFITVRVVDANGSTVPRAANRVKFTVDGPGEIIATDNGDPTNLESFPSPQRDAFNGHVLAIVRSTGRAGRITVHAGSAALQGSQAIVQAAPQAL